MHPKAKVNLFQAGFPGLVAMCCIALSALTLSPARVQAQPLTNSATGRDLDLDSEAQTIWERGIGEGFRRTAQSLEISAGANLGLAAFGGEQAHDLALVSLSYSHMLSGVLGENHWYRGNTEIRLELFTGAQFSPSTEWLVGLTPHLRYNFATGTHWIPFVEAGAGVTATGIGPPDLSGTFEFNLQAGAGVRWFLKENQALTVGAYYTHWSCAGIHKPNLGLNGVTMMVGWSFFF